MSTQQTNDLLAEIEDLPELLPLPDSAMTLLSASKDPNVGAREMCQIVSCDASLSVRLLQVANSSRYGVGGQIKTVEHASVVLGSSGLRDIAMSIIAQGVFQDSKTNNPAVDSLWKHSLGCATVARTIAETTQDVCPDEAFVSGIMHDVGKLVLIQILQDKYDLIPQALAGVRTTDEELARYGICHSELGQQCAEQWGLPFEIGDALLNHHEASSSEVHTRLSSVIVAANQLSKAWKIGNAEQLDWDPMEISAAAGLSFDEPELEELQARSAQEYVENQKAFQG